MIWYMKNKTFLGHASIGRSSALSTYSFENIGSFNQKLEISCISELQIQKLSCIFLLEILIRIAYLFYD